VGGAIRKQKSGRVWNWKGGRRERRVSRQRGMIVKQAGKPKGTIDSKKEAGGRVSLRYLTRKRRGGVKKKKISLHGGGDSGLS